MDEPGEVIYYLGIIDCLTHVRPLASFGIASGANSLVVWFPQESRAFMERADSPQE